MAEKTTHIKVTEKQRDFIKEAAKRLKKPMGEFAFQCVQFIHRHRYDPYNYEDVMLGEEFKKFQKQIVSFLRKHEQEVLKPMRDGFNGLCSSQKEFSVIFDRFISENSNNKKTNDEPHLKDKHLIQSLQKEVAQLRQIINEKDVTADSYLKALQTLKSASLPKKGKIFINLKEEEFANLVSPI